mgnify:CR=1 FL=1
MPQILTVSEGRLLQIQQSTKLGNVLQKMKDVIRQGWLEDKP